MQVNKSELLFVGRLARKSIEGDELTKLLLYVEVCDFLG